MTEEQGIEFFQMMVMASQHGRTKNLGSQSENAK